MTAVANVTYVSPDTGAACGLPRGDAWTILREPATSDMPWPGFLLGQTPASIWYWCADQMMVQKAGLIRKNDRQSLRSAKSIPVEQSVNYRKHMHAREQQWER